MRFTFPSAAVLCRTIQERKPTLLVDEVESLSNPRSEVAKDIRAILNTEFEAGGVVPRCGGKRFDEVEYSASIARRYRPSQHRHSDATEEATKAVERFARKRVSPEAKARGGHYGAPRRSEDAR
jgi:hypothetical protein